MKLLTRPTEQRTPAPTPADDIAADLRARINVYLAANRAVPHRLLAELWAVEDPGAKVWSPLFEHVAAEIGLPPGYELHLGRDELVPNGRFYYQIRAERTDAITGEPGRGAGGKAYLSPYATRSELVQTAFGLFKGYQEHEAREFFTWRGKRVFGPHIDTEALASICERTDYRGPVQ